MRSLRLYNGLFIFPVGGVGVLLAFSVAIIIFLCVLLLGLLVILTRPDFFAGVFR
jgi:hypothetical protein